MMKSTSLDAYRDIKPQLGQRQKAVLDVLRHMKRATNTEISRFMGLPINQVTPRINELRKKGKVVDAGLKVCKHTKRNVHAWRAV